ncbi:MAG: VanW family protein [Armatimonadetes bacterium]|nr:VanW family protein [Candidatus Hippobium faecium]
MKKFTILFFLLCLTGTAFCLGATAKTISVNAGYRVYEKSYEDFMVSGNLDEGKIGDFVSYLKKVTDKKPINSAVRIINGKAYAGISRVGYFINENTAKEKITQAVLKGESQVTIDVETEEPDFPFLKMRDVNTKLASYTTDFSGGDNGKCINIALSAEKCNGSVLLPGEEFSFNKTVGPRSEETGFADSICFENGRKVMGMGGGICQTSTTIFNAVLLAGLEIAERHNHSLKVFYVPLGQDAMVAWGYADFKFRNNTDYPVVLFATVKDNKLICELWGNEKAFKICGVDREESEDTNRAKIYRYETDQKGNHIYNYETSSKYKDPIVD